MSYNWLNVFQVFFLIYSFPFHLLLHLRFSFGVSFFFFLTIHLLKEIGHSSCIFHSLNFACFIPVVSFNTFLEFLSCKFCHLGLNLEACSDSFLIFGQVYFGGAAVVLAGASDTNWSPFFLWCHQPLTITTYIHCFTEDLKMLIFYHRCLVLNPRFIIDSEFLPATQMACGRKASSGPWNISFLFQNYVVQ